MKNIQLRIATTAILAALASSVLAQQAECDPVIDQAANAGKTKANDKITKVEGDVKNQITGASECMQKFGTQAARNTIKIGGGYDLDLSVLQNILAEKACSIVQTSVNNKAASAGVANPIPSNVFNSQTPPWQPPAPPAPLISANKAAATTASKDAPGFFDGMSCKLFNKC